MSIIHYKVPNLDTILAIQDWKQIAQVYMKLLVRQQFPVMLLSSVVMIFLEKLAFHKYFVEIEMSRLFKLLLLFYVKNFKGRYKRYLVVPNY